MRTAEAIYYMEETQLRQFEFLNERERNRIIQAQKIRDFGSQYQKMTERGIRFIPYFSEEYPHRLREIQDPPYALYIKGSLPDPQSRKAAVIGGKTVYTLRGEIRC